MGCFSLLVIVTVGTFLLAGPALGTYFDEHTLFRVEWPGKPKSSSLEKSRNEENVYLVTKNNENYVCVVPKDRAESDAADLRHSFLPSPNEIDLLRPLFEKDVCVVKITSYWTYELCHGKGLKQFHKEEGIIKVSNTEIAADSSSTAYILGNYPEPDWRNQKLMKERYKSSEKAPLYRFSRVELPYYPVNLEPGDICDITMQPRKVRVLYFCQPDTKAEFFDIQETSTCNYEILIFTSYLCDNKKYRASASTKDVSITCYVNDDASPNKPVDLAKFHPSPPKYRDIFGRKPASKKGAAGQNNVDDDHYDEDDDEEPVDDFWILDQFGMGPAPDLDSEDAFSKFGRKSSLAKARKALGQQSTFSSSHAQHASLTPPAPLKPISDYQHVKDFLRGSYCLHGGMPGGWWRYELCFGRLARQYHDEITDDRRTTSRSEVTLGNWRAEKHIKWLQTNPAKRPKKPADQRKIISYLYSDGDVCDATGQHRQTIVKLICNPLDTSEAIGISLSEPSVCIYEIDVIAGQWLCDVVRSADDDGIFDLEGAIDLLNKPAPEPATATTKSSSTSSTTATPVAPSRATTATGAAAADKDDDADKKLTRSGGSTGTDSLKRNVVVLVTPSSKSGSKSTTTGSSTSSNDDNSAATSDAKTSSDSDSPAVSSSSSSKTAGSSSDESRKSEQSQSKTKNSPSPSSSSSSSTSSSSSSPSSTATQVPPTQQSATLADRPHHHRQEKHQEQQKKEQHGQQQHEPNKIVPNV